MHVKRITSTTEFAALRTDWAALDGGVPFRSWPWLESWWRSYGAEDLRRVELYLLAVYDPLGSEAAGVPSLVGLAPLYLERPRTRGRVLKLLGSGEVCSDYLGILCRDENRNAVALALASWLTAAAEEPEHRWDLLELSGIDAADAVVPQLADELAARGSGVHERPAAQCWRIELPATWDDYLAELSKSHRKQVRRLERSELESGRAVLKRVQTPDDLVRGQAILVDLHQRRRKSLGQPGCFSSRPFAAFHNEALPRLLESGTLRLSWLELEGRPVAVEYHLAGREAIYAYQSGVEPDSLAEEPGRLVTIATLRQAIEEGARAFDFLRGDEPYKAHWRASPRPMRTLHIVSPRTVARLRHRALSAGRAIKVWIKATLPNSEFRIPN